ncbi:MAG: carboxypeptidase regulatory-like domain-containing protein [Acidobacteria bacterium]|nr:carboxypeptidase regulatory-like domain-containing protein [Acidobacteriota bacterium]
MAAASLASASEMAAQDARKITGVVVSAATRQPVAGAAILYEEVGRADQTTTTDEKGSFTISFGRLGVVTVTARNFGTASRRWPPRTGGVTLRIELEPPVGVSGTLVDRVNGRAIAGAITILMRQATSIVSSTAIAERGEFKFGDLPSGSALVISRADGYAPGVAAATLEPKVGGNSVRVGLLLEAQAAGTVVDSASAPVAEAEVLIAYVNNPGAGVLESYAGGRFHTQADGEFALRALGPGHADRAPGSPRRPNVRRGPGDGGAGHDPKRDSADARDARIRVFGDDKFWTPVGRIDNAHGDRNLVCACPPVADYADAEAVPR